MLNIRVNNMKSSNGNDVPNQFIIWDANEQKTYFQSYATVIACRDEQNKITLDENSWDYSVTTGKYRSQFLGEGIAETRKKIESGEYKLADLN